MCCSGSPFIRIPSSGELDSIHRRKEKKATEDVFPRMPIEPNLSKVGLDPPDRWNYGWFAFLPSSYQLDYNLTCACDCIASGRQSRNETSTITLHFFFILPGKEDYKRRL